MTTEAVTSPIPALVVDASVAVEALDGDERALAMFADVLQRSGQLLVPAHFWAEVANLLVRRHGTPIENGIQLRSLADVGVEVADRGIEGLIDAIALGDRHRLSAYDALYLQLALDLECPLATFDRELAAAARLERVPPGLNEQLPAP